MLPLTGIPRSRRRNFQSYPSLAVLPVFEKWLLRRSPQMRSPCELTTSPNIVGTSSYRETNSAIGLKRSANCAKRPPGNHPEGLQADRRLPAIGSIDIRSLWRSAQQARETFLLLGGSASLPSLTPARWQKSYAFAVSIAGISIMFPWHPEAFSTTELRKSLSCFGLP